MKAEGAGAGPVARTRGRALADGPIGPGRLARGGAPRRDPALSETPRPPQRCSAPGSQQRREARNALALVAARGQFLRRHALAMTVGETHAIGIAACSV